MLANGCRIAVGAGKLESAEVIFDDAGVAARATG